MCSSGAMACAVSIGSPCLMRYGSAITSAADSDRASWTPLRSVIAPRVAGVLDWLDGVEGAAGATGDVDCVLPEPEAPEDEVLPAGGLVLVAGARADVDVDVAADAVEPADGAGPLVEAAAPVVLDVDG